MLASREIREKKMRLIGMAKICPFGLGIVGGNPLLCHGLAC